MTAGRPITRRGYLTINKPANTTAGTAIVLSGQEVPNGAPIEGCIVAGSNVIEPPDTATWFLGYNDANGFWVVEPAPGGKTAGTYVAWVRLKDWPRTRIASAPFTVT